MTLKEIIHIHNFKTYLMSHVGINTYIGFAKTCEY